MSTTQTDDEAQTDGATPGKGGPIPERVLYPLNEARQLMGDVGVSTLYRWESLGLIRMVKVCKRRFIHADEIARVAREGISEAA